STYGAGGRVDGVTVRAGTRPVSVTVHIVVRLGEPIPELAETVSDDVGDALRSALADSGPWEVGVEVVDVVSGSSDLGEADPGNVGPLGRESHREIR
ncbi:MAG: hypothetical protein M3137_15675, partial [Actinomycetota bacterium]|nr:hypothetical protein [Actinomycetota bacterium]